MEPPSPAEANSPLETPLNGRGRTGIATTIPFERTFDKAYFKPTAHQPLSRCLTASGVTPPFFVLGALFGKPPPLKETLYGLA
jgi:hypothetical protein